MHTTACKFDKDMSVRISNALLILGLIIRKFSLISNLQHHYFFLI